MAETQIDPAERPPDFRVTVEQSVAGLADADKFAQTSSWFVATGLELLGKAIQYVVSLFAWLAAQLIRGVAKGFANVDPAFGEVAKAGLQALFGIEVPAASVTKLSDTGAREQLKRDVGKAMISVVTGASADGASASIEPSLQPAERYLGTIANFAIEGWMMEMLGELESLGYLQHFGELKDVVAEMFGFGRLTRRVLGPIIDVSIANPTKWYVNKIYRPTELSPASAVRQFLRGKWEWADVEEELARQGYGPARIDALLNEQRKFLSVGDVRQLLSRAEWTNDQAIQHLREQGYDEDAAQLALRVEGSKRFEQLENAEAAALTAAFVSRDIDDGEFGRQLGAAVRSEPERALLTELAQLRRAVNIRHLSSADVAAAIHHQILAFPDYRAALRREGYTEDAITVKDLLLRAEIDTKKTIAQHQADAAKERAAEKAARDKAAADKRAQVEADRLRQRRGTPSTLERAVVRGLVPIARYAETLGDDYDADTVDVMVRLVEDERQVYLEQQQRAADAAKRAAVRGLDVGQLQQAVLAGVLTLEQFRQQLAFLKFDAADVAILASTLAARKADQDDAQAKRAAAETAAKRRSIDLTRFEQLVRRGIRTIADYGTLLTSLGFDEADRAAMIELLQAHIVEDAKAADARAAAGAKKGPGGLTIDQFRRAVLLGLKTEADYDSFLTASGLSADVHALLAAELHDDLAQAEAARQRRAQGTTRLDARALPLATVARAARLGIVAVDTYQQRLARDGYTADDIAIETELLLLEIADVQAARMKRDQVERTIVRSGLSLADVARGVKAGALTLDDYRLRAVDLGVAADDVETLVRVLGDELSETKAAQVRRSELESDLKAKDVSLAVLEDQVRAGAVTIDRYFDTLIQLGIAPEDADVLFTLLSDELSAVTA